MGSIDIDMKQARQKVHAIGLIDMKQASQRMHVIGLTEIKQARQRMQATGLADRYEIGQTKNVWHWHEIGQKENA